MSSTSGEAKRIGVRDFLIRKERGEKIVVVAAYDALFARLSEEAGADAILVGDSLGNVILGLESTLPVTIDQMIHHGAAARRGLSRAMLIVDMPFLSYQTGSERALLNCGRVMQETGAQAVKIEGGSERVVSVVSDLVSIGIPVMGHLGFTPQSVHAIGGFRVQGRDAGHALRMIEEAKKLEAAGAFSIVLELVPAKLAGKISAAISIPTIGIGAGAGCDGQVLVLMDLLGLNDGFSPRYLKRFANMADDVRRAVKQFRDEVVDGHYPTDEHSF